jgi:phage tail tube protein FII
MEEVLAAGLEAGGTVGHHTLTLGSTDLAAQVGLAGLAELALATFGGAGRVSNDSLRRVRIEAY